MTKRLRWTEEAIENELRQYRANKCKADGLRLDLEAARDYLAANRDESIEAAALHHLVETDAVRTGNTSDATGRLAMRLPDDADMKSISVELAALDRRVRRVNAWLRVLTNRERLIVDLFYLKGMVWGEVIFSYNAKPTDGLGRDESTLKRWRREAIRRIGKVANS